MTPVEEMLLAIATRELGVAAPPKTVATVREATSDHALSEASEWLVPLLQRLIDGATTVQPVEIPVGYPHGESGLSNVLLDLASESWMDFDDCGEGSLWRLRRAGLEVFICREHSANWHTYEVRRIPA